MSNFEFELFLSTDGKHTVHIKADTDEGREKGGTYAAKVFDAIKAKYGTKQEQSAKAYNGNAHKEEVQQESKVCPDHGVEMTSKQGKYGKFWSHKLTDGTWCNRKEKDL